MKEAKSINSNSFNFLLLESINYILLKKEEKKNKQIDLEDMGFKIGEKITNHLLNLNTNKVTTINEIIIFLGKEVWSSIFNRKIAKLQTNNKGVYIIDCDDFRFINGIFTEKVISNETISNVELMLSIVCGIIKGTLSAFNLESIVTVNVKPQLTINNLLNNMLNLLESSSSSSQQQQKESPYVFNITLLNSKID